MRDRLHVVLLALTACARSGERPVEQAPTRAVEGEPRPMNRTEFRHTSSRLVIGTGAANHRGRDALVVDGESQTIEAKFAYGPLDKDLKDEDVVLEREGSTDHWQVFGVARTSEDGQDDGGRVHFHVPPEKAFPLGRHSVRATVMGDGTQASLTLVVAPRGQKIFVSDVDGTLTASEIAEFPALARGRLPAAHPAAAETFRELVARGYVPVYLTARPEWLLMRTRAFLAEHHFPEGVLITRRDKSGAFGAAAAAFKRVELERLASSFKIEWAFGNMPSDAVAYASVVEDPRRRVLFRQDDPVHGARRIESYAELLSELKEAAR